MSQEKRKKEATLSIFILCIERDHTLWLPGSLLDPDILGCDGSRGSFQQRARTAYWTAGKDGHNGRWIYHTRDISSLSVEHKYKISPGS